MKYFFIICLCIFAAQSGAVCESTSENVKISKKLSSKEIEDGFEEIYNSPKIQKMLEKAKKIRTKKKLELKDEQALDGHAAAIAGRIRIMAKEKRLPISVKDAVRRAERLLRQNGVGLDYYKQ